MKINNTKNRNNFFKLWCINQIYVKNCSIDQTAVYSQTKLIFGRLKEGTREFAKDEVFKTPSGWFSRFKTDCNWHNIAKREEC